MRKIPVLFFIVFGIFCIGKPCKGEESGEESSEEFGKKSGEGFYGAICEEAPTELKDLIESVRFQHNSITYLSYWII